MADSTNDGVSEERDEPARASRRVEPILDHLLEGCQVIGFDYRYLYLNDIAASQGRRSKEQLLGRTMMECYPGIDQSPMFARLQRCLTARSHERMENEFTFPDGTRLVFELKLFPVAEGACILSLDVTERRHRLAAIVNDSDDAIVSRTLDGLVTSWNRSAERIFGYSAAEMIGRPIEILFPPSRKHEEAHIVGVLSRGGRIEHFETRRLRKDGREIDVSVTLSPIRGPTDEVVGISKIARDVTDLKAIRRELVLAKEAAEAANRELESFSYSVAHDLRTPLRGIDGFSQALLEDYDDKLDADGKRYLRYVRESAQHMATLIDDILTLSRISRCDLVRRPVDISALARAAIERLRRADPQRVVDVVVRKGLLDDGDPQLVSVVLDNLLGNAWKFTSKRAHARIELDAVEENGRNVYLVRDNGAGFDMRYRDKLFGVFQRLHPADEFEGTGIGLATVQRIVHRHRGRVWAEAQLDVGTTIHFTLGGGEEGV